MSIVIGALRVRNRVFLAPMSGVSDEPFRAMAQRCGAGLVISEMVASEELLKARPDMVKRAKGGGIKPFVIQLAGREARWMAEGARLAQDLGADIIDINMGCPAREVTGGLSGSALMRDLDHALALIEATVAAATVPVTLKMRLGWSEDNLNAPELARRAEAAGIRMVSVHGRTRCQFYKGRADWRAIALVKRAVAIPVIANGDCVNANDARAMLAASGADGIMIGRGSYGRPWWPGVIAQRLDPGSGFDEPGLAAEAAIIMRHHESVLAFYGHSHGNKVARKHIGWAVTRKRDQGRLTHEEAGAWRGRLLQLSDNRAVAAGLAAFYACLLDAESRAA